MSTGLLCGSGNIHSLCTELGQQGSQKSSLSMVAKGALFLLLLSHDLNVCLSLVRACVVRVEIGQCVGWSVIVYVYVFWFIRLVCVFLCLVLCDANEVCMCICGCWVVCVCVYVCIMECFSSFSDVFYGESPFCTILKMLQFFSFICSLLFII